MIVIALGLAMVIMDTTIVNVALPSIISDLSISSVDAEWVQAVYALMFAMLLIVAGRLGDRIGRRRMFVAGAAVFAVASVLAAVSQSGGLLIASRALQGVGGAMMSPSSLSLVNATYRGSRRTVAFAIYGSVIGTMAAIGPMVGGFLTAVYSWRWAFGVNVPVAAVVVIAALVRVPESRQTRPEAGFDALGSALSALGIGSLVFGLIEGRSYGWWTALSAGDLFGVRWHPGGPSPIPVVLTVAVVALVALWFVERSRHAAGRAVLIDVSLFRIPTFGLGSAAALILSLGEYGVLFSLPLFLQSARGYTPMSAGLVVTTLAVGSFVSGPTTPRLARRWGPRAVARLGMGLEVIGIAGIGLAMSPTVTGWHLVPWLVVYGMGVGYASAQLTGVILADVPVGQSGQASGTQSTARQVGSALGTAVLGTVLFVGLAHDTQTGVARLGLPAAEAAHVAQQVQESGGTVIDSLATGPGGTPVADAAVSAFAGALKRTALVGAGFVGLGLAATMLLPADRRRDDDDPTPAGVGADSTGAAN